MGMIKLNQYVALELADVVFFSHASDVYQKGNTTSWGHK